MRWSRSCPRDESAGDVEQVGCSGTVIHLIILLGNVTPILNRSSRIIPPVMMLHHTFAERALFTFLHLFLFLKSLKTHRPSTGLYLPTIRPLFKEPIKRLLLYISTDTTHTTFISQGKEPAGSRTQRNTRTGAKRSRMKSWRKRTPWLE